MVAAARRFVEKPRGFLSIHGGFGNGKTTALMAVVNALVARGIEARYMTAAQLMAHLRDAFNSDSPRDSDYDRLRELSRVPVLCVDELDKTRDTQYTRELLLQLINERYRAADLLGTVFAWNGGMDAIPFPAVVSRISEFPVIHNDGGDVRPMLRIEE